MAGGVGVPGGGCPGQGGASIHAQARRLILALLSLGCLVGTWPFVGNPGFATARSVLLGGELLGAAFLALCLLLGLQGVLLLGVGVTALVDAVQLSLGRSPTWAPLLGAALLLSAELGYWSLEESRPAVERATVWAGRGVRLLVVVAIALGAALCIAALGVIPVSGGLALTFGGAVAAVAVLGLAVWLARGVRQG